MNGFNSKFVCKNSSVTIWKILFNIAIPIIYHKWGVSHNKGRALPQQPIIMINPPGLNITGKPLWYPPWGISQQGVNENFTPVLAPHHVGPHQHHVTKLIAFHYMGSIDCVDDLFALRTLSPPPFKLIGRVCLCGFNWLRGSPPPPCNQIGCISLRGLNRLHRVTFLHYVWFS